MVVLINAVACSILLTCEPVTANTITETQGVTVYDQSRAIGTPVGTQTQNDATLPNDATAMPSVEAIVAQTIQQRDPAGLCNGADIYEASDETGERVFKKLNDEKIRDLNRAARRGETFSIFVKLRCPEPSEQVSNTRSNESIVFQDASPTFSPTLGGNPEPQLTERTSPTGAPPPQTAPAIATDPLPAPTLVPPIMTETIPLDTAPVIPSFDLPQRTTALATAPVFASPAPSIDITVTSSEPIYVPLAPQDEAVSIDNTNIAVLSAPAQLPRFSGLSPQTEGDTFSVRGWVYLGANVGGVWNGRHFLWSGDLPETGMPIDVIGSVNIRDDYIRYSRERAGLTNPEVIGAVLPGQSYTAQQVVETSPGHYWAEIILRL